MRKISLLAVVAVLCLHGVAKADLSGLNPWTGNGRTWADTTEMEQVDPDDPTKFLRANVEWAVEWISSAGEFKYTYQMECTGDFAVTLLGVPMLKSNEAENIGSYLVEAGNIAPQDEDFTYSSPPPPEIPEPTLAWWSYTGLSDGQVSYGLTYWSVNAPLMLGGYIQDGGLFAAHGDIPSPSNDIPEPTVMGLLVTGMVLTVVRRRKR